MKILMVCLGNICRSPLAEGILQQKSDNAGLHWQIDSAGTARWHAGSPPDKRSIDIASKYGIDISQQRSRPFRGYDLEIYDLIYAMDKSNYQDIIKHTHIESERNKVHMIMDEVAPRQSISVPDPYYGASGFEKVYHMLDRACEKIVRTYQRA